MKNKFTYTVPDSFGEEERLEFWSHWDEQDLEWLASDAARDYYYDGGWDREDWPIELVVYDSSGERLIGRFEVEREFEPTFSARKVRL